MSNRRKTRAQRRPGVQVHVPPVCPDQDDRQSQAWAVEHVTRCDFMPAGRLECGAPAVGWIELRTYPSGLWQAFGYCSDHGGMLGADLLQEVAFGRAIDIREGDSFGGVARYRVCLGGPGCDLL